MSTPKRSYHSAARADGARATHRRILAAAARCFAANGYAAASVEEIAREAGVSLQTVYNSVGRKPEVLKATYDVLLAGDDEPIAINDRPLIHAVREATDPRAALSRYAGVVVLLQARVGGLVEMIQAQAAVGDPDLQEFAATIARQRYEGASGVITHLHERFGLRAGLPREAAVDVLWSLTSGELQRRLVDDRGWPQTRFETWLAAAMSDLLLGPASLDERSDPL